MRSPIADTIPAATDGLTELPADNADSISGGIFHDPPQWWCRIRPGICSKPRPTRPLPPIRRR